MNILWYNHDGLAHNILAKQRPVKSGSEVTQLCPTLQPHGLEPTRLLHPQDFPGKSSGVGCHLDKLFIVLLTFLVRYYMWYLPYVMD